MLTDVDEDSQDGQSCRVLQSGAEIRVDGFHVDDVHLERDRRLGLGSGVSGAAY